MNSLSPYAPSSRHDNDQSTANLSMQSEMAFDDEVSGIQVRKYWYLLRKYQWLILGLFLSSLALATYATFTATPIYTATSLLLIKPNIPDILGQKAITPDLGADEGYSESFYKTQYAILSSRSLAATVISNLGLEQDKRFIGSSRRPGVIARLGYSVLWCFGLNFEKPQEIFHQSRPSGEPTSRLQSEAIDEYLSTIAVIPVPDTSLVGIHVSTASAPLSSEIANAHAQAYEQLGIALHDQAHEGMEKFLELRLDKLRAGLEASEARLNNYRRANGLIPGLISLDGKQTVVVDRLADLSKELTAAEGERIALEAQVHVIGNGQYASLPVVINNADIQALQTALNTESADLAGLSNRFTSSYPPLAQLQAKVEATEARLQRETRVILESVESEYQVALDKEVALRNEVEAEKQEDLRLNDAAVEYAMLQREVDSNRDLINQVLLKIKDVSLEAESNTSNAIILDKAEEPRLASSPKKKHEIAEGGLLGLSLAIVIAIGIEYMTDTMSSPEDMERFLRLPNLGVVPEFSAKDRGLVTAEGSVRPGQTGDMAQVTESVGLVSSFGSYSVATEGYRSVRTGLLLSRAGSPPRLTLVTSAIRGEGKTITSINTAIMLAQAGARVLVIDADLRRGRCARVLGMEKVPGLTEYLIGALPVDKITKRNGIEGLFLLPAGTTPPNSTELVGSQRMRELLQKMSEDYDFVVVDSPPIVPVSDALVLSTMVDGVVLVIDSRRTPKTQVKAARARLEYARAKVFGFVVNRMHLANPHYYYSYNSYYAESDYDELRVG